MVTGEGDQRLKAVVGLAQSMAAAHAPREAVRSAAEAARRALGGSFAAVSVWERELGRLRVLVNSGELAVGEEEFPEHEFYPVHEFPEITEFLHEQWARGGEPHAWVEVAAGADGDGWGPGPGPGWDGTGTGTDRAAGTGAGTDTGTAGGLRGALRGVSPGRVAALRRRGRGSCVVAPIVLHGRAWGELYVARRAGEPVFGRADADFATVLAAVTAAGIAQTERLEEARRLAFTDPLTGLGNRRAVDIRLDEALEEHRRDGVVVSLVMCDLNGLKQVNDTLGHAVGDRLLERFGSVLSLCGAMLPGALAARLGGDEFCLVEVGPSADEVVRVADELCRRAAELELGEGVACGLASTGDPIGPVHTARRLFRLADAAQYRAKAARSAKPVVAGREGGPEDPVVRLADSAASDRSAQGPERRRFRGRL
ncbi:secreted protein [Streptomyces bingchenggensis BCW-1]|uniref:Secreted protein n=1 Tax=Streptomyces bingchenggensis (strain BCW-1) TaxID=749414 RepID=D7BXE2_STRBB|nr:secreted protein [Streptomyces bingchenggensis BCW-1]